MTKLVDHSRVDGGDEPFVDRTSSGERGSRFQSNKAMMSYDNLLRDLSLNVSAEKEAINEVCCLRTYTALVLLMLCRDGSRKLEIRFQF